MIVNIPGQGSLQIKNLLLDFNGTIAHDGKLIASIKERIYRIHETGIEVHVITADTHGTVKQECLDLPVKIQIFDNSNASANKKEIAEGLGARECLAIGNGFNDRHMFETCALSIVIMGDEGCSAKALLQADIVCKHIDDALDLILKPNRMIATLRG